MHLWERVAYRDVGEGREQDAEASRRDSRRGRRSHRQCQDAHEGSSSHACFLHKPLISQ